MLSKSPIICELGFNIFNQLIKSEFKEKFQ